jgi:hypothetical protein
MLQRKAKVLDCINLECQNAFSIFPSPRQTLKAYRKPFHLQPITAHALSSLLEHATHGNSV